MDILNPYQSARDEDLQETDLEEGFSGGDWDPHTGTKASQTDGEASDACSDEFWDPEDDPEVKDEAENHDRMVEMLSDLEKNDLHDHEWKLIHKRKKSIPKNGQFAKIHWVLLYSPHNGL